YQHRICKRYAARQFGKSTPESWLRAKAQISEIIEGEYARKKLTTRKRLARFQGEAALLTSESSSALEGSKVSQLPGSTAVDAAEIKPSQGKVLSVVADVAPKVFKPSFRPRATERQNQME